MPLFVHFQCLWFPSYALGKTICKLFTSHMFVVMSCRLLINDIRKTLELCYHVGKFIPDRRSWLLEYNYTIDKLCAIRRRVDALYRVVTRCNSWQVLRKFHFVVLNIIANPWGKSKIKCMISSYKGEFSMIIIFSRTLCFDV